MIDLRRLEVFRAVAQQRSFSAAAAALNYTQSSVSQHVTNLERQLGVTLLDRTARPVAPTAAGNVVLRHAEELLGRASSIERELGALAGGETGHLRLGGFFTAWATFIPAAVASVRRRAPRGRAPARPRGARGGAPGRARRRAGRGGAGGAGRRARPRARRAAAGRGGGGRAAWGVGQPEGMCAVGPAARG